MGLDPLDPTIFENLKIKYEDKKNIWLNIQNYDKEQFQWLNIPFKEIDINEVETKMHQYEVLNQNMKLRQNLDAE